MFFKRTAIQQTLEQKKEEKLLDSVYVVLDFRHTLLSKQRELLAYSGIVAVF